MKKLFTATLPAIAVFLLSTLAASGQWTEIPTPSGPYISGDMEVLNGKVYTSHHSDFKLKCLRTDDYIHWSLLADLPVNSEYGLSQVIVSDQQLYLFSHSRSQQTASAWTSDDEGQNWQSLHLPSPKPYFFIPFDDALVTASKYTVQHSADNGLHWEQVLTLSDSIWDIKRLDDQTVLLITVSNLYRSADQGLTWEALSSPFDASGMDYPYIYLYSTQPGVFAELDNDHVSTLYRSYDNGTSWTQVSIPYELYDTKVRDLHTVGNKLWGIFSGGAAASDDGGETWEYRLAPHGTSQFSSYGDTLFAGCSYGFFKSYDQGQSWLSGNLHDQELGIGELSVSITAMHSHQGKLYLSSDRGLFSTINDGIEWRLHTNHGPFSHFFQQGDTLAFLGRGLRRSFDGGNSWHHIINEDFLNPLFGNYNFARVNEHLFSLAWFDDFVYRSADFGATWEAFPTPSLSTEHIAGSRHALYVNGWGGVYTSVNLGQNFQLINSGLGNSPRVDGVWNTGDHVFLSANYQLWKRDGDQWLPASVGLYNETGDIPYIFNIVGDTDNALLAGKNHALQPELYLSRNGGAFWEGNLAEGLPLFNIHSDFSAILHNNVIYAAGSPSSVFDHHIWKRSVSVTAKEPIKPAAFNLFPNPAQDITWLTLDDVTSIQGRILLHDFTGRLVGQYESTGESIVKIPLHSLSPGMYSVSLLAANGRIIQAKLVVF
ncbi:MAG TPA: T9SS type A sorting domain-containing protein [Saprospiraceae bacterium]|nr:T9SS type A sorting domain-containing protein [Saprospiraceae bacterium]